jgi:hypothetical protein
VLAWDNGSTDATVDILREWIPARLPGRIVADRPHAQLGACLAAMVEAADTELLARMDGDDVCHPDRLAAQVGLMERRRDLGACGTWGRWMEADGRVGEVFSKPVSPAGVRLGMLYNTPLIHPSVMLRRRAVLAVGNYGAMGMGQDLELWHRLTARFRVANIPRPLLDYRRHESSVGAASAGDWPALHRQLMRRHAAEFLPRGSVEELMELWEQVAAHGSHPGRTDRTARTALAVIAAMARGGVYTARDVLSAPETERLFWWAAPPTLKWRLYGKSFLAARAARWIAAVGGNQ